MSCYQPLKAFPLITINRTKDSVTLEYTKNNKIKYKICDYNVRYIYLDKYGNWNKSYEDYETRNAVYIQKEFTQIPCGYCLGCRLDHAKMWSARCMLETKYHKSNYFLTLTYDNEHLPFTDYCDKDTGELLKFATLQKRDLQLFIKRLRKYLDSNNLPKIRYFAAGEYGSATLRPHYHMICFGLELNDLVPYKTDNRGYMLYNSKTLDDIWQNGFVVVGQVTEASCGYTARYCVKKALGSTSSLQSDLNVEPEFLTMSTRPAIAKQYFYDNPNLFDYDYITMSTEEGGIKFKPPRYFEKLYEKENELPYKFKKAKSECLDLSTAYKEAKLMQTDLEYLEMLKVEEQVKANQIKALTRKEV